MQCSEFDNLLEQEPDLRLSNAAAAHLDSCSNCRSIWHDLAAIRTASLDWRRRTNSSSPHVDRPPRPAGIRRPDP